LGGDAACNCAEGTSNKFNLPASLIEAIPRIGDYDTAIVMHNDAVVQASPKSLS
jgi:hypothetical protein